MNQVILIGRLTHDPELRFIAGSGTAVSNFTLAVDRALSRDKKAELEAQGKPTADFPRIKVWGKQAENVAQYTSKGSQVAVQGSIETGFYINDDGTKVYTTDVKAFRVQFLDGKSKSNDNQQSDFSTSGQDFMAVEDEDDSIPF